MEPDYKDLKKKRLYNEEKLSSSLTVQAIIYFIVLVLFMLLAAACSSNRIRYSQSEVRLFKKTDSLNLKIEPSEIIKNERRYY